MQHVLLYIEKLKETQDKKLGRIDYPFRLRAYFIAIDNNETEKYWDYRDCIKKRMSWKDYYAKWGEKMKKNVIIRSNGIETFVSSSEKDNMICPVCLATNTLADRKCRNCGFNLKKGERIDKI